MQVSQFPYPACAKTKIDDLTYGSLLSPIGQHRRSHIKASKGKRAAKRKRQSKAAVTVADDAANSLEPPPKPALSGHVDAGFNSITRTLQSRASEEAEPEKKRTYSMVFVSRGNQTSAFNSQFPSMIAASTKGLPNDSETRLVGFSKPCSDKLSASLGLARVSSVAIASDAPGVDALWELVKQTVKPIHSEWLADAKSTEYKSTQIKSVEITVGPKKAKPKPVSS